ncbi:MAG: head-tail adaptor protein [Parvibaculum sp.]|uniref:phage head closure protein n=1 Tax=Parvibaculum sp. TaxID=2024848 RepID=UPI000C586DBE|nr:phage head closure protein [Parvibaculum sp.]MAU62277.1 head-tail adaptor protein [Parvibaculum sp.]
MTGIAIGEMRERVTLQSPQRTPDGAGGANITWTSGATVWAKVEERRGQERLAGGRLAAHAALTLTIRYRSGITTEMRVLWKERVLNITSLRDPDGRKRFLELTCEGTR